MFQWHDSDLRVLLILGAIALFGMIVYLIKHKKIEVKYSNITGEWSISNKSYDKGVKATNTF